MNSKIKSALDIRNTDIGMSEGKRLFSFVLVMVVVSLMVMVVTLVMLYRAGITSHREHLLDTVQSQARLIEAVARYDALNKKEGTGSSLQATMSQILDANINYQGFGTTGEFVLARLEGDKINFIMQKRYKSTTPIESVPFDSVLAEPMRLALQGLSGSIIGLDYRGETVMAAYEPVAILKLGLVAKIDLAELRKPFVQAALTAAAIAFMLILGGTALFFRLGQPIITQLRKHSLDLEREIIERKQAEEEKHLLEQQLQHSQKQESLGQLSAGIAHNFNNILAIIIGYCGLTKLNYQTAEKNIPIIEKAAERAAELSRQMMAYAGKAQISMVKVNMKKKVDEIVGMLTETLPQNTVIKTEISTNITMIEGEPNQLHQVVMNLILNASEAIGTEQGEIKVSLAKFEVLAGKTFEDYNHEPIPPGEYLCLEVTDNGCGMDEATKARIFEPFYTTKFTGRGLGMSAVLGIIKSHAGALQLFSQLGQGTTFKVYLPALVDERNEDENLSLATPPESWQGSGTILLVEDEE